MLKDNADKVSGDDKGKIESAISAVKDALKTGDASAIKSASEKLNEVWQAVSAELYKAASEKTRAERAGATWRRTSRRPATARVGRQRRRPDHRC